MARIRQIRDVIFTRKEEDLDRDLAYREMEVRALMTATYIAGKNQKAAEQIQNWKLPRPGNAKKKIAPVASAEQIGKVFGNATPEYTMEDIAARRAELEAEAGQK